MGSASGRILACAARVLVGLVTPLVFEGLRGAIGQHLNNGSVTLPSGYDSILFAHAWLLLLLRLFECARLAPYKLRQNDVLDHSSNEIPDLPWLTAQIKTVKGENIVRKHRRTRNAQLLS